MKDPSLRKNLLQLQKENLGPSTAKELEHMLAPSTEEGIISIQSSGRVSHLINDSS
jgi:hypothetical protein